MCSARLPPGQKARGTNFAADSQSPSGDGRLGKNYGDPFLLRALNGPVVVTGREDLIKTIHGQDPNIYSPFATATIEPLIGAGSMLILEGDPHRRERRLVMPMFHGDRMKAYGQSMQESALEQFELQRAGDADKKQISTLDLMTAISLVVIVRTIFGGTDRDLTMRLMSASRELVAAVIPCSSFRAGAMFRCSASALGIVIRKPRATCFDCSTKLFSFAHKLAALAVMIFCRCCAAPLTKMARRSRAITSMLNCSRSCLLAMRQQLCR